MASPLESAITLEDVFAMVEGKRVPLAPELAGYMSLEIAEKADAGGSGGGGVDPRSVYIADEGTVALVRPRDPGGAASDAEQSIRAILGQLLEASGSSTPALTAVARRGRGGSLRSLMEEIEAALIPVNRAAGRRALARLAREVKRVTHGVGRNAPASRASTTGEAQAPDARAALRARASSPGVAPPAARSTSPARPPSRGGNVRDEAPAAFGVSERLQPGEAPPDAPSQSEPDAGPPPAMFDNPSDVDSLLEQFSKSTTQSKEAVSRDLKDLVDIGQTSLPPAVKAHASAPPLAPPLAPPPAPDVDDLLALGDDAGPSERAPAIQAAAMPPAVAAARPGPAAEAARTASAPAPDRDTVEQRPPTRQSNRPSATSAPSSAAAPVPNVRNLPTQPSLPAAEWARPKKKRTDYWLIIALMAALACASAAAWLFNFKPGFLSGRTAEKVAEEKATNEALKQKQQAAHDVLLCHAALDVTDVPTGAEVLLRVGQAPVDIPHLPVGARLEFVATAEGFAPKRVVVPAGATWDNGPDGKPRFEVAVQLDHSNPKAKLGDSWPPGEAGSEVGGKGAPGTVHTVSTPRGAEIWMLAGLGPEALVEQLPCDQSIEVLVAGPTTFRKRLHAAPADFVPRPGEAQSKIAKLSAR